MINFKSLFYRNFLSTGNAGTTILLDRSPTTLVQGQSGAGKSTMIDALCFVLYGKPFRNINKPGLVNSVNGKNCEVEVVFDTHGKTYKIVRTIKPNKFDIYCNDKLVTQDAAVKDYQKVLENQILMMSFKTFTQIVILGSTAFTPFMQLPAGARREVIEDILDIGIFSTMNMLLKQHVQETKDQQSFVDTEIKTKKERADGLKRLIDALSSKKEERIQEINEAIETLLIEEADTQTKLDEKIANNEVLSKKTSKLKDLIEASNNLLTKVSLAEHECDVLKDKHTFFDENDHCPTCSQEIGNDHKRKMVQDLLISMASTEERLANYKDMRSQVRQKIDSITDIVSQVNANNTSITALTVTLKSLQSKHLEYVETLTKLSSKDQDIDETTQELKQVAKDVIELSNRKKELAQQRQLQEGAALLLRDTGVKTAIIKEYLPLINRYLNKYLVDMQLDVEFTLDENFNEVIKSRYRDEFVYSNFSTGERLRVDIALLMTWRKIASLKNSASTNLLIIDEILSGTLDQANQDIVVEMVNSLGHEGSNIFIISHADSLMDKFRSGIRFEKHGNFSIMV